MFSNLGSAFATAFEYFTIIYLTGLGGLFSERSGIVNIGLEGMMIIGTVSGAYGVVHWGPVGGLAFGFLCGALYALIHAAATVTFKLYAEDGTLLWSEALSTNLPTGSGRFVGASAMATCGNGGSTVASLDLVRFGIDRTLAR
jgi:hypothetical protein